MCQLGDCLIKGPINQCPLAHGGLPQLRHRVIYDHLPICVHLNDEGTETGQKGLKVVHAVSIAGCWEVGTDCVPVSGVSHPVEHFGDCLLIVRVGWELITELGRNLQNRAVNRIATLCDHLGAIGVLCFVHAPTIAHLS